MIGLIPVIFDENGMVCVVGMVGFPERISPLGPLSADV